MVLYPILLSQSWSTTMPNFMLVSGIAQSGKNLALSRLAMDRLESVMLGIRIGGVNCNGPTCADDTTAVTEERGPLQTLLSISDDYSGLEQYHLQLLKVLC